MKNCSAKAKKLVLKNKNILLGITGGVAAYKSVDLVRRLKDEGASVTVIMTDASQHFITSLTFEVASENPVYTDLWRDPLCHITLPKNADLMLIAPATANIVGKFANAIADDLLSTCFLSFIGPVIIAPAMNWRMYENPIVQANFSRLAKHGVIQVGPEQGKLACGEEGIGKMSDVNDIIGAVKSALSSNDLSKKKIIVTAGPTREYLDPVRFISNRSSGKMGYAIASASIRRGAETVLISGPSALNPPSGLQSFVRVETTEEMRNAVFQNLADADMIIMAAAPADFYPEDRKQQKIEKSDRLSVSFRSTTDILSELGAMEKRPLLIGFSAETGSRTDRARIKLIQKKADIIVFNDISSEGSGFDVDTNKITLIERDRETPLPLLSKDKAADAVLDAALRLFT